MSSNLLGIVVGEVWLKIAGQDVVEWSYMMRLIVDGYKYGYDRAKEYFSFPKHLLRERIGKIYL